MRPDERFDADSAKTKLAFMGMQLLYTVATLLPARAMMASWGVHVAFLALWGTAAAWHGGQYYIE
jgi:hypothetical protein